MRKSITRRVFAVALILTMIVSFTACGGDTSNPKKGSNPNGVEQNNAVSTQSRWGLMINGKEVQLPCTLAELAEAGVEIQNDAIKEMVLNSTNQKHLMIGATCGDKHNSLFLKIITGADADKKEANAVVYTITNNDMVDGSYFTVKNGLALGASVGEIIAAYGEDYVLDSAPSKEDLTQGFVMMHYGDETEGMLFWFMDGQLNYIELFVKESE